MKDGEVVFLIAGFAALAFLLTQDKSGKEEKPSQPVIDAFGPADEPMMVPGSEWEGGSEKSAGPSDATVAMGVISKWFNQHYVPYRNEGRRLQKEVEDLIHRAQSERREMRPFRDGLRQDLSNLLKLNGELANKLHSLILGWTQVSGHQGADGQTYPQSPTSNPYNTTVEELAAQQRMLQGWVTTNADLIETLREQGQGVTNVLNARLNTIINVVPAFETVTAMSESTEGQPLLPTASVMSMFNAGNKDDADNSEQAGIAKLQHRGTDSKGTGKNLANEEANAGFMSNDTRNDPSVKLNEDKAKALQNIQTITTPAHADPPPVPEERPLVDANTRETEFVSVQKAGGTVEVLGTKRADTDLNLANAERDETKRQNAGKPKPPDPPAMTPVAVGASPERPTRVPPQVKVEILEKTELMAGHERISGRVRFEHPSFSAEEIETEALLRAGKQALEQQKAKRAKTVPTAPDFDGVTGDGQRPGAREKRARENNPREQLMNSAPAAPDDPPEPPKKRKVFNAAFGDWLREKKFGFEENMVRGQKHPTTKQGKIWKKQAALFWYEIQDVTFDSEEVGGWTNVTGAKPEPGKPLGADRAFHYISMRSSPNHGESDRTVADVLKSPEYVEWESWLADAKKRFKANFGDRGWKTKEQWEATQ